MKKVEAIIRPEKVNAVISALLAVGDVGVTIYEAAGHGKQRSHSERSGSEEAEMRTKMVLVTVVEDHELDKIVKTIAQAANTGRVGDGKIFVSDLRDVIRIRTLEHGDKAIE